MLNEKIDLLFFQIFLIHNCSEITTTTMAFCDNNNYCEAFAPNEVSIFVPHIDTKFSYKEIVEQMQDVFQLGLVDRIEALPKVNQKDGHPYLACFVYFWKWSNSSNAQMVYNNMMENKPSRMYLTDSLYWVILPNMSEVATLPLPRHLAFQIACHENSTPSAEFVIHLFDVMNIGKVNEKSIQIAKGQIQFDMDYWYHSKTTHEIQELLENHEDAILYVDPNVDYKTNPKVLFTKSEVIECGYDKDFATDLWTIMWTDSQPNTPGVNPYIWFARQPDHPLNCEHPKTHSLTDRDIFRGMPTLEPIPPMVYEELVPMSTPIYYVPVMFYPCVV